MDKRRSDWMAEWAGERKERLKQRNGRNKSIAKESIFCLNISPCDFLSIANNHQGRYEIARQWPRRVTVISVICALQRVLKTAIYSRCLVDVITGNNDHQSLGLDKVEYTVSENQCCNSRAGTPPGRQRQRGWEAAPYGNGLKSTRLCYKS